MNLTRRTILGASVAIATPLDARRGSDALKPVLRAVSGDIYARAGETSCCVSGHPLAVMTRDVKVGACPTHEDFPFIRHGFGFGHQRCPECGGHVIGDFGRYYFLEAAA